MNRRGFLASLGAALALPLVARFKPTVAAKIVGVDMAGGESVAVLSVSSASTRAALGSILVEWANGDYGGSLMRSLCDIPIDGDTVELCRIPAGSRIVRVTHKFDNPIPLRDGDTLTPPSYMISLQSATNQRQ